MQSKKRALDAIKRSKAHYFLRQHKASRVHANICIGRKTSMHKKKKTLNPLWIKRFPVVVLTGLEKVPECGK